MHPSARLVLAPLAAAVTGVASAVILGEYELTGATPWLAGVVVGFLLGEVVLTVAHVRHPALGLVAGVAAGGAILWAAWIASGEGVAPYPAVAWPASVIAVVLAATRAWPPRQPREPVAGQGEAEV